MHQQGGNGGNRGNRGLRTGTNTQFLLRAKSMHGTPVAISGRSLGDSVSRSAGPTPHSGLCTSATGERDREIKMVRSWRVGVVSLCVLASVPTCAFGRHILLDKVRLFVKVKKTHTAVVPQQHSSSVLVGMSAETRRVVHVVIRCDDLHRGNLTSRLQRTTAADSSSILLRVHNAARAILLQQC